MRVCMPQESVGGVVDDDFVPSSLSSSQRRSGVRKYAQHPSVNSMQALCVCRHPFPPPVCTCSTPRHGLLLAADDSAPPIRRSRKGRKGGGRVVSQGMRAGLDPLAGEHMATGRGLKIGSDSGPVETSGMKIY